MTLNFDAQDYPYASKRHVVYARNGMCNAGNPHAASAGLQVLLKGGNAVDAAVAMASAMPVVEPTGNGIGADCFAIVWFKGRMYGLNASGPAPMANSVAALKARGHEKIPSYGVEPIDVPGCVGGWAALHERFGSMPLEEVMAPAIRYAEEGYPVTPNISRLWEEAFNIYSKYRDRPEFKGWFDTFAPNGTWLKPGEMFRSPDMAATLREIAATKGESFYRGAIADKIDAFFKAHNGFLTKEDLAAYRPEWVEPISVNYRGYDVWELPPNGHGITVLMALQILKGFEFAERDCVETMHRQIEAMKLAMVDTARYVAEPSYMKVSVDQLLSEDYAARRRALIGDEAITPRRATRAAPPRSTSAAPTAKATWCRSSSRTSAASARASCSPARASPSTTAPKTSSSTKPTKTRSSAASAPTTRSFRASSRRTASPWAPSASWAAGCSPRPTCRSCRT